MEALIQASKARVSVGEVMEALAEVFGYYEEPGI
jgi:methylmalonyl-CoA mutase N-terminal domain/subunit